MTIKPNPQSSRSDSAKPAKRFPDMPPREDMNNPLYLHDPGHQAALRIYYGESNTTIVLSETPLGWTHSQRAGILVPDLLIAFGIERDAIVDQRGYAIDEWGQPPDFVLEVASNATGRNDYTTKRAGYAEYGVPEYWRFDHTGGRLYPVGLAGDRLVNGVYEPIDILRVDDDRYRGHSEVLGLDLCWEYGQLRWFNPASGSYLRTHAEERLGRQAAERAHRIAEARNRELEARIRELEGR